MISCICRSAFFFCTAKRLGYTTKTAQKMEGK
uniref:Uncharacterized protein n=1 Tax=Siphoviridae sp. ctorp6 TaxID=2825673 RepID=A0A8S5PCS9_9CAUD|nr:MAG TPA: hypothetical protein [Siphoviridae sp. ctorp6]